MISVKHLLGIGTCALSLFSSSYGNAGPITILTPALSTQQNKSIEKIVQQTFPNNEYRQIKVQLIYDRHHQPDHLLVYLFRQGYHGLEKARINLNAGLHRSSLIRPYHLNAQDLAQQPGIKATEAKCPDEATQFIAFAPNDDQLEQDITKSVADEAQSHHLHTVYLAVDAATRSAYLNYMACPKLVGNFYDGDADPEVITTADGIITYHDIEKLLAKKFHYKTTNIWLACEAYNDPIKSAVMDTAQSQKYAAGINDLLVGPSDRAAACTMNAALAGQPIEASFQDCYQKFDSPEDQWGIGGQGSDYFGQ